MARNERLRQKRDEILRLNNVWRSDFGGLACRTRGGRRRGRFRVCVF